MGNNQFCRVARIGQVRLRLQDGTVRILGQVRRIPVLRNNSSPYVLWVRMGISSLVDVES